MKNVSDVIHPVAGSVETLINVCACLVFVLALAKMSHATTHRPALQSGEASATSNSQLLSQISLCGGDELLFPAGDYYFANPIDFSSATAQGVTIYAEVVGHCTLHAQLKVGAMCDVVVSNLTFKGLSTPAVSAVGTERLTIANCTLENVKGDIASVGSYPYSIVNVTDFKLTNPVYPADSSSSASTLWDGQAYLSGGSQTNDSEARTGEIVCRVDQDLSWGDFVGSLHLKESAFSGKALRKIGGARLSAESTNLANLGVTGVNVAEGDYFVSADVALGVAGGPVKVSSGAALVLGGASQIKSRTISIAGSGFSWRRGAVLFVQNIVWNKTQGVTWELTDDATIYSECKSSTPGDNGVFYASSFKMNGHTLTLVRKNNTNVIFSFAAGANWYGGGNLVADDVPVYSGDGWGYYLIKEGAAPTLSLKKGATFIPRKDDIFAMFSNVVCTAGTKMTPLEPMACVFDSVTGPLDASDANVSSLTIKSQLHARVDDIKAGNILKTNHDLILGEGATVEVDTPAELPCKRWQIASATDSVTGEPKTIGATHEAGFRAFCDPLALLLGPQLGLQIFIR